MDQYENIGLDNRLRAKSSLISKASYVPAIDFSNKYEVSSNKLNASKVNLGEFIKVAGGTTAAGTFNLTQFLNFSSTITYKTPKGANRTFGAPILALYQGAGTASANQIWPQRGANVTLGRYDITSGVCDYASYNGTSINYKGYIVDTNGTSSQVITFAADWLFTDYVTDDIAG